METNEPHYSDIAVDEYKLLTLEYLQQNPQEVKYVINSIILNKINYTFIVLACF